MITRDNYEEFFLLYIDNELPIAGRQAVERFVAGHPDLREEWEALLQCRVIPDRHLSFPGRDALQQPAIDGTPDFAGIGGPDFAGAEGPDFAATEGPDFLSYIDGELDEKDRVAVEEFVRQHPQFLPELGAWRNTISYPDPALVCPDKERLYKRERKPILLPWVRIGAAAAIAGIVALLLLPRIHRQTGVAPAVAIAPAVGVAPAARVAPTTAISKAPVTVATTIAARPSNKNKKDTPDVTPVTTSTLYNERDRKEATMTTTIATTALAGDPALRTPEPVTRTPEPTASTQLTAMQAGIPREESSFATQALQNENNDPDNNSLVTNEPTAPGKGRLRGIFRKVTRVFGKTADRDKDGQKQVLVGAFQFALN